MKTQAISSPSRPDDLGRISTGSTSESGDGFRSYLRLAAQRIAEGDRMLASVVSRGPGAPAMDTSSLLALQAGMYRYTQELELAGRVVDRSTQALKTTLQSQS